MGYYDGSDEDFSFSDVYAPLEFGTMRGCEARVWSFFRTFAPGMDAYLDYAMGYNQAAAHVPTAGGPWSGSGKERPM